MSGFEPATPARIDPKLTPAPTGDVRHGSPRRSPRRSPARRLLRLRLPRCGVAGIAVADAGARARRRTPFDAGTVRRRGSERAEVRPGPHPRPTPGSAAHRSAAVDAGNGSAGGVAARVERRPTSRWRFGRCTATPRVVDRGRARDASRTFPVFVLRSFHTRRGPCADGVSPRLAHGPRKGPAPARRTPALGVANASATARRAPSAPPSAGMSVSLRAATREQR